MENTRVDRSMELVPIFIESLEFLTEEGRNHEMLGKFEQGRVYKGYIDNGQYFLFPGRDEPYAWMMPNSDYGTENYHMKFVVLTEANFTSFDVIEEDMEFLSEIFQSDMGKEIKVQGSKEEAEKLDLIEYTKIADQKYIVDEREAVGLFEVLNKVNPNVARGLLEFGKFVTIKLQVQNGIDKMLMDVLMDEDLGKGACTSGAMNSIIKYSQDSTDGAVSEALKAAMYILLELSRKVKKHG